MKPSVLIFADLTEKIGTGHFWRCARLAGHLADDRTDVTFLLPNNARSHNLVSLFRTQNQSPMTFQFIKGISNHRRDEKIIAPLPDHVVDSFPKGFNLTIVDSHRLAPHHLGMIKKTTGSLMLVDDINHRNLTREHVDMISNPCLPADVVSYGDIPTFSPPDYHFLPPAFFIDEQPRDPDSVFVAFSGIDFGQISIALLQTMKAIDPDLGNKALRFKVALGGMEPTYQACAVDLCKTLGPRFEIVNSYDAPKTLGQSGMLVCSGSQLSFEAAAAGTPIAGVSHISKPTEILSSHLKNQGVPYGDLYGIIKGHDVSPKIFDFAQTLLDVFEKKTPVTVARPNPNGMQNLLSALKSTL